MARGLFEKLRKQNERPSKSGKVRYQRPVPRISSVWWRARWSWCGTAGAGNDFGHCMGSHMNERGTKLWDLRGCGIFHLAEYWTDEGPLGENDRRVSVGNLTSTVDDALGAQLRRIRAYGGWTSWNLGLNYLSCMQDGWQLTRRWQFASELLWRGWTFCIRELCDKFGSLRVPSNIGIYIIVWYNWRIMIVMLISM